MLNIFLRQHVTYTGINKLFFIILNFIYLMRQPNYLDKPIFKNQLLISLFKMISVQVYVCLTILAFNSNSVNKSKMQILLSQLPKTSLAKRFYKRIQEIPKYLWTAIRKRSRETSNINKKIFQTGLHTWSTYQSSYKSLTLLLPLIKIF